MFTPARQIREKTGVFVALSGCSNSGKSYSALELATGIAGSGGKIAVVDTEGGRTLHLRDQFDFDAMVMSAPFRPEMFANAAIEAEQAGYACLLIDSFSQEWSGLGGVLSWHDEELEAAVQRAQARDDRRSEYAIREANKMAAWIKPKSAHKAMVASLLQRRIPIVFSIRGEETVKPGEKGEKPQKIFKSITDKSLPFEMTVAFRLDPARKGYIDLSDPATWKLEGAHREIFKDGDRLSREHGAKLLAWSLGLDGLSGSRIGDNLASEGAAAASRGTDTLQAFWGRLSGPEKHAAGGANKLAEWKKIAAEADRQIAAEEGV